MFGRDEKVSSIRLTAAQYIILGIFLVLAYGLWRLQVMQSDYYSLAAEKNRVRNVPVLAPRGRILDRNGRTIVDNYPSFSALLLRDSSRDLNRRRRPDRQGFGSGCERRARPHPPLCLHASVPADLPEGRHHSRRIAVHRSASQRVAGTGHNHGPSALVPAQRVHGPSDRLRRRSQRRHAEPAAIRTVQRGRRGRHLRGRAPVQQSY